MNRSISSTQLAEGELARRSLIGQVVVQAIAVLLFWWAVDALVRTAIEIYEEFDLELPVNTINFVWRPGAAGVGAVTLGLTLLMGAAVWLPSAKWAGWLAAGLFLATVFYLAVVALFAVAPLVDIRLVMGDR